MKTKVKVQYSDGTVKEGEVIIRDTQLPYLQEKYPSRIFRNKKKYTRKTKHKRPLEED